MIIEKTGLIESEYYSYPALSKSFLANFSISPAHAFIYRDSKALSFGRMFHEYCLEPQVFKNKYIVRNNNIDLRKKNDHSVIEFIENSENKIIVKEDDYSKILAMHNNLSDFIFFDSNVQLNMNSIIKMSICETGFFSKLDNINIKCKPDIILDADKFIYIFDLKTLTAANDFKYDVKKYKYVWQDYLYSKIISNYFDKPVKFIFVACEKNKPFGIKFFKLEYDSEQIESTIDILIRDYCMWKDYGSDKNECYSNIVEKIYIGDWR